MTDFDALRDEAEGLAGENVFTAIVDAIEAGGGCGGGSGIVESVVAGDGVTVDATDPANPIVSATGGSLSATTHITAARFETIGSGAPIELVPAPGVGKVILPSVIASEFVYAGSFFNDPAVTLGWEGTTDSIGSFKLCGGADVENASVFHYEVLPMTPPGGVGNLLALVENKSIVFLGEASSSDPARGSTITTSSVADGGSGYAIGDTGTIQNATGITGTKASYIIDTVDGGGAVLTYHLTFNADPLYNTDNNPLTTTNAGAQPGSGTGFTVNVDSIPAPDGDFYVTVDYAIVDLH